MDKQIREAFDSIHASEELKTKTLQFLAEQKPNVVEFRPVRRSRRLANLAACLAVVFLGLGMTGLYFVPVSAIHIDSDPAGTQLGINCFSRVVSVETSTPTNENALADLRNMQYEDAVERVLQANTETETDETVITIVGSEKMMQNVENRVQTQANIHCHHADKHTTEQAANSGMSAGKYSIYLSLIANGADITPEQAQSMTMRDLRALLNQFESGETTEIPTDLPTAPPCNSDTDTTCNSSQGSHNGEHNGNGNGFGGHNGNGYGHHAE